METESPIGLSFPRRRKSSIYGPLWTPAFAGVTIEMALRLLV